MNKGIQKLKMASCKQLVLLSQLIDEIETQFQGLTPETEHKLSGTMVNCT